MQASGGKQNVKPNPKAPSIAIIIHQVVAGSKRERERKLRIK
jgi:hypothetical protein